LYSFTLRATRSQHKYFGALSSRYYTYSFTQCPLYLYQPRAAYDPGLSPIR